VQIFEASVRDNITLFDPAIADARVLAVLEEVGLGAWCARLPAGLESDLTAGGLSAGEAQLLAFARVFLRDPDLVILDEASSRLDPATDRLIERATDRLLRPRADGPARTAIIIAHKLATVRRADRILVLDHGRVAEFGPRAALAADPASRFAGLLRSGVEGMLE
jgi:ABC-type multidrug transport system fused ATPase/permease subunit